MDAGACYELDGLPNDELTFMARNFCVLVDDPYVSPRPFRGRLCR